MQVTLTASDLAAMPNALRQDLFTYLAMRRKGGGKRQAAVAEGTTFQGLAVLDGATALALVRNVSFGHKLKGLHDLLETFSYDAEADAPGPERLVHLLKLDGARQLRRYFNAITRLLKRTTRETAPLARYSRHSRTYLVHPTSRASLREVFAQLVQSGVGEEPPWA
jgi:hypothetical protein